MTTSKNATCKGCKRPIIWAMTEDGTRIPLDPKPPVYRNTGRMAQGGSPIVERVYGSCVSHFATCPAANQFSGSKRPKAAKYNARFKKVRDYLAELPAGEKVTLWQLRAEKVCTKGDCTLLAKIAGSNELDAIGLAGEQYQGRWRIWLAPPDDQGASAGVKDDDHDDRDGTA